MLKSTVSHSIAIVGFSLLMGCASTPVTLDRSSFSSQPIGHIDIYSPQTTLVHQKTTGGFDSGVESFAVLGAIIGASVDAVTNSGRKREVEELVMKVSSVNFTEVFVNRMTIAEKGRAFTQSPTIQLVDEKVATMNEPHLTLGYYIAENYRYLGVVARLEYRKGDPNAKPYTRTYSSIQTLDDPGVLSNDKIKNLDFWASHSTLLVDMIFTGMDEVINQFVTDFNRGL